MAVKTKKSLGIAANFKTKKKNSWDFEKKTTKMSNTENQSSQIHNTEMNKESTVFHTSTDRKRADF
jgi:hypothetical protein